MENKIIGIRKLDSSLKNSVLSLGGFDGIHLGHQALIQRLIESSKQRAGKSCLCLFDPLPFQVLNGEREFKRLFTIPELSAVLEEFDLDFLCVMPFDGHFSKLSSQEFIQSVLLSHFDPLHIVVGYDFSFSYQKEGNFSVLQSYGKELGFSVEKVEPFLHKGQPISSSRIRKHLSLAEMKEVRALLGRPFSIQSRVLKGEGRGRELGYPTANLQPENKDLPPWGVYSGKVQIQKKSYPAIVNIGCRPSFDSSQRLVEVHILSFKRDIYGQILKVELDNFIREERKFSRHLDLKRQIRRDIQLLKSKNYKCRS